MNLVMKRGEAYIISEWDFKGPDDAETLVNHQFGLVEDYPQLRTGSSIEILGPATANNTQGRPDYSSLSTTYLETTPSLVGRSQGYGPLNMIYRSAESVATPYTTDGSGGHGAYYTGYVGIQITTGDKPIMVTHLGRFKVVSPANQLTHQVVIMKKDLGVQDVANKPTEIIASVIVDPNQPTENRYNYTRLQNPVILQPNTTYYVASYENCQSSTNEHYLSSGPCALTSSTLWSSATIDTAHGYAMNPSVGTWSSGGFTPIVNLKAQ